MCLSLLVHSASGKDLYISLNIKEDTEKHCLSVSQIIFLSAYAENLYEDDKEVFNV